ncbi:MAG TPA: sulfatase-like hydrolase/transferase [Thermoleophilaceae bacterium]
MTKRELLRNAAQLAGLWGLAVAQPLFEVTKSGEVFALAGWRGGDIVVFALVVAFLPPLAMTAVEALVGRLRPRFAPPLHVVFVGFVCAILVLYAVKHETDLPGGPSIVLGLLGALAGAYLFRRFEPFRAFLTVVSPASLLFVLLFLFGSPVKHLVLPEHGSNLAGPRPSAPVVVIVFDEFPTLSLLNGQGELDRRTYPGFADLARNATWYRNATTVADHTIAAVPAILTGRRQDGERPASVSASPDNLLALFGRRGGAFVQESETQLCPRDVCPERAPRPLPGRVTRFVKPLTKLSLLTWMPDTLYKHVVGDAPPAKPGGDLGPVRPFAHLWATFGRTDLALRYLHRPLPHQPWNLLPSGRYWVGLTNLFDYVPDHPRVPTNTGLPLHGKERWVRDPNRAVHMRQRHLAQARYSDRLLEQTLQRLRSSGLYDRAIVVVTADHGVSFVPGLDARRLTKGNEVGIVPVPMFVKLPHQRRAHVSERFVETVDIAPTIAAALGVRLPWRTDGRSALDATGPDRRRLKVDAIQTHERLEFDSAALIRGLRAAAARQADLFYGSDPDRIFRPRRYGELVGHPVGKLPRAPAPAGLRYTPAGGFDTLDLHPDSGVVPALVSGTVSGPGAITRQLAIVLNGTVAATTVAHRSDSGMRFESLVAERYFRPGPNRLELFAIVPDAGGPRLAPVAREPK